MQRLPCLQSDRGGLGKTGALRQIATLLFSGRRSASSSGADPPCKATPVLAQQTSPAATTSSCARTLPDDSPQQQQAGAPRQMPTLAPWPSQPPAPQTLRLPTLAFRHRGSSSHPRRLRNCFSHQSLKLWPQSLFLFPKLRVQTQYAFASTSHAAALVWSSGPWCYRGTQLGVPLHCQGCKGGLGVSPKCFLGCALEM